MSDWEHAASSRRLTPTARTRDVHEADAELQTPLLGSASHSDPDRVLSEFNARMQNEILKFRQDTEQIAKLSHQLGTQGDTRTLRAKITDLITECELQSGSINKKFRDTAVIKNEASRVTSLARNKLQRDFHREMGEFQSSVRDFMEAQKRFHVTTTIFEFPSGQPQPGVTHGDVSSRPRLQHTSSASSLHTSPTHGGLRAQSQRDLKVQTYEDFERQELEERDREIATIQHTMNTVNQIYKDLAVIVEEQKPDLDQVEAQVDVAHDRAFRGKNQLDKASSSQQSTSKTIIWILAILIGVGIIAITLFVSGALK